MCLYLREKQPRVAKEDISVLKYVRVCDEGITSPCQNTKIPINKVIRASPKKAYIKFFDTDKLGNNIYSLGKGTIHAKLIKGGFSKCEARKAIIPAGTKY